MFAYYNEIDPNAAEWIRELIKNGLVTDGEVDERSIEDVLPADVNGFDRCHFFAGIAAWDYALNLAGFEGQVWTGSCPCQPFSTAGKREGFDDERHLWPAWFHLIDECRPHTIFGEQVASKDGLTWLDLVSADVEGIGYTIGAVDLPAAGVGAPHRRQRMWFVADSGRYGFEGRKLTADGQQSRTRDARRESDSRRGRASELAVADGRNPEAERQLGSGQQRQQPQDGGVGVALGDTKQSRLQGHAGNERNGNEPGRLGAVATGSVAATGSLGNAGVIQDDAQVSERRCSNGTDDSRRRAAETGGSGRANELVNSESDGREQGWFESSWVEGRLNVTVAGFTNGFWANAKWIYCRDGKYRPVEPSIFPLANGISGRVGLLRGAGNAISPWAAKAFIESWKEVRIRWIVRARKRDNKLENPC